MKGLKVIALFLLITMTESSVTPIEDILNSGNSRLVAIEISNNFRLMDLFGGRHFVSSGHNSNPPSPVIKAQMQDYSVFQKARFAARGAVGFLQYRLGNHTAPGLRFLVFFSVPFDRNFAKNWYGLRLIGNEVEFGEHLYQEALTDESWSSANTSTDKQFQYASTRSPIVISKDGFVVTGWMSDTPQALFKIAVDFFDTPFKQVKESYKLNFNLDSDGNLTEQSKRFDEMIFKTRVQFPNRYSSI